MILQFDVSLNQEGVALYQHPLEGVALPPAMAPKFFCAQQGTCQVTFEGCHTALSLASICARQPGCEMLCREPA